MDQQPLYFVDDGRPTDRFGCQLFLNKRENFQLKKLIISRPNSSKEEADQAEALIQHQHLYFVIIQSSQDHILMNEQR